MQGRYSRQAIFGPIGQAGQREIGRSRVAIVGCGALGTVAAEMLARAGVGCLRLIDRDFVELSNLQRQSLFSEEQARQGIPKAAAAKSALSKINSEIEIESWIADLTWVNIEEFLDGCRIVVDGSDNFETRFLVNDFSVRNGLPWTYGAALGSYGIAAAFDPSQERACLRCLVDELPALGSVESCETGGILSPAIHAVAAFESAQVLKFLVGAELGREILQVDVWNGRWRTSRLDDARRPDCECCSLKRFPFLEGGGGSRAARLCGRNAVQITPSGRNEIDFQGIELKLRGKAQVDSNPHMMRIGVEGYRIALFRDGRSIVQGTEDPAVARAVVSRYVGN